MRARRKPMAVRAAVPRTRAQPGRLPERHRSQARLPRIATLVPKPWLTYAQPAQASPLVLVDPHRGARQARGRGAGTPIPIAT